MRKIKIAQIGTGHDHAVQNFNSILKQSDIFDVVGYARVEGEDGANFQQWSDKEITLEELFATPDLEAVTVETFDLHLVKYAQMAGEHGLHVFMDKPGSENCEDFERMLSTLKRNKKVFSIGYMYRYNQAVQEALRIVKAGKLGEIYSVEAQMSCDNPTWKREWLRAFRGGMTFYLGCHLVDLVYSILGIPEEIIPYNVNTGIFGVTAVDSGFCVFKYKNGTSFIKSTTCEPGGYERRQLIICGAMGTLELRPLEWAYSADGQQTEIRACYRENENDFFPWLEAGTREKSAPQDRYDLMTRAFAEKIKQGIMPSEEYEREARVHRLVLQACGIDCDYKAKIKL